MKYQHSIALSVGAQNKGNLQDSYEADIKDLLSTFKRKMLQTHTYLLQEMFSSVILYIHALSFLRADFVTAVPTSSSTINAVFETVSGIFKRTLSGQDHCFQDQLQVANYDHYHQMKIKKLIQI